MASGHPSPVLKVIRGLIENGQANGQTDAQLLERFVTHRDEAAFAALMQRHGPMVLAVCQRVLCDSHEAEDAFQVTFLVLARKARSLGRRDLLGNWLHGVAYRTAMKARAQATHWKSLESQLPDLPALEPLTELAWRELQLVLDAEIQRLPAKYRAPAVLCYLEGKSYTEAARDLSCPPGTVSGRLARARELLRRRLVRRGFTISAGLLSTIVGNGALSATVPNVLVRSTIRAATHFAATGVLGSVVSAKVATLTEGMVKAMLFAKLKIATASILVLVTLGLGVGGLRYGALAGEDTTARASTNPPVLQEKEQAKQIDQLKEELAEVRAERDLREKQAVATQRLADGLKEELAEARIERDLRAKQAETIQRLADKLKEQQIVPTDRKESSPQPSAKVETKGNTLAVKNVLLRSVNAERNTISVTIGAQGAAKGAWLDLGDLNTLIKNQKDKTFISLGLFVGTADGKIAFIPMNSAQLENLPVAKNAKIVLDGKESKLADLKADSFMTFQLATDGEKLEVREIHVGK